MKQIMAQKGIFCTTRPLGGHAHAEFFVEIPQRDGWKSALFQFENEI
jgi:hypothetical protein